MELFILRHGQAAFQAARDQDRQLTPRGQEEVHLSVSAALAELRGVQKILVSPYVRAQQTAALAAEYLPDISRETEVLLTPEAKLAQLCQMLHKRKESSLLLVSHQPLVGQLVNWLCGLAPGRYSMGTAALACIDTELLEAQLGDLRWLRHPGE